MSVKMPDVSDVHAAVRIILEDLGRRESIL